MFARSVWVKLRSSVRARIGAAALLGKAEQQLCHPTVEIQKDQIRRLVGEPSHH